MLQCSLAHALSCPFMYCSFTNMGSDDVMCSTVSANCLQDLHLLSASIIIIVVVVVVVVVVIKMQSKL
jgi:hypothetical protein